MDKNTMPAAEGSASAQPPVVTPAPAPMPAAAPAEPTPVVPPMSQQPTTPSMPSETIAPMARPVEPAVPQTSMYMETPIEPIMRPIDLSAHEGTTPQASASMDEGKKKLIIITIVIVAGLAAGVGGFFAWRMMGAPTEEIPVTEQMTPEAVTPPVAVPVLEVDDISVIEKELNAFTATDIDKEAKSSLDAINAEL